MFCSPLFNPGLAQLLHWFVFLASPSPLLFFYCYLAVLGFCECCRTTKGFVETETQVYLVVATAMLMGFIFGLVFGLLDVEDEQLSNLKAALMREERFVFV
jgi:hypothetical protein